MNIFTLIHTTREGESMPIISMGPEHLVNLINLRLNKLIQRALQDLKTDFADKYAPDDMSETQRKALHLRRMSDNDRKKIEESLEEAEAQMLEKAISECWPYIIVGVCRNDTRDGIVRLLQDVTGINDLIELQSLMKTNSNVSISLLASGNPILNDDDDLFEDLEFPFEE